MVTVLMHLRKFRNSARARFGCVFSFGDDAVAETDPNGTIGRNGATSICGSQEAGLESEDKYSGQFGPPAVHFLGFPH